jgi:HEPN domain-containing protein
MNADPENIRVVHQWIEMAEEDLTNAEYTLTMPKGCPLGTVCFHAQQCAEKYLKGLLTLHNVPFPKTHDLLDLLQRIPHDVQLGLQPDDLTLLNRYSVEVRYPGHWEPITRKEAQDAVAKAKKVRETVNGILPRQILEK